MPWESTCPKLHILSPPCHFLLSLVIFNVKTFPLVRLEKRQKHPKRPRHLKFLKPQRILGICKNVWNITKSQQWEVSKGACVTAAGPQTLDIRGKNDSSQNLSEMEDQLKGCWSGIGTNNKDKTTTRAFEANTLDKQSRTIVVKWNAEEKRLENRGGHSKACFSLGGRVLTIGCKDNMFSIKAKGNVKGEN